MPAAAGTGLPAALAETARIYLRPVGLTCGNAAEKFLGAGQAKRLAGGPWVFAACEVALRAPEGIRRAVASLAEIEAWADRLAPPLRDGISAQFGRLTVPRRAPGGGPLERPLIMGVVDASSDPEAAVVQGRHLTAAGADILEIGGESDRPDAPSVEAARVRAVLQGLAADPSIGQTLLSVETRDPEVTAEALAAGAAVINGLPAPAGDPNSLASAARSGAQVVLAHGRGDLGATSRDPDYTDAPLDVFDGLEAQVDACISAGIARARLIVDPGLGFAKRGEDNLAVLRALALYQGLGCPVLLDVAREDVTGVLDRSFPPRGHLPGSLAAAVHALDQGVQILKVRDVAEFRQALDLWRRLTGLA
ncbi:MAG: dihydropteroate synthase [Rhodospirillales bacterium]|nr:dihydropteroate synthase [Rhodospirillales bacterium]MDH3969586.1 dihydropteroate synthase [Rhodospirillales bacterium]